MPRVESSSDILPSLTIDERNKMLEKKNRNLPPLLDRVEIGFKGNQRQRRHKRER